MIPSSERARENGSGEKKTNVYGQKVRDRIALMIMNDVKM